MLNTTYNFEPTDTVYIIEYSNDLLAETVVTGTVYRVDITVRSKLVEAVEEVLQVPSNDDIAAAKTSADNAMAAANAIVPLRDAAALQLATTQNEVDAQTPVVEAAQLAVDNAQADVDALNLEITNTIAELDAATAALAAAGGTDTTVVDEIQARLDVLQANTVLDVTFNAANATLTAEAATLAALITVFDENTVELTDFEEQLTDYTSIYEDFVALQTITTEFVAAVEEKSADVITKYVIRTEYNESVCIENESLIFLNKMDAFTALKARTP